MHAADHHRVPAGHEPQAGNWLGHRWTTPDGVALHARDYAAAGSDSGLPVVCLHGLTRNARDFEALAPWIAGLGRRVVVPDVRGRGQSGRSADPMRYVPATYARDVVGQLKALGIERAIFLGTSMGGIIAMLVAARRSKLVAGAILNDVGPEVGAMGLARIAAYAGAPVRIDDWTDALAYAERIHAEAFPALEPARVETIARRLFCIEADGRPVLEYDPNISVPIRAGKAAAPKWVAWFLFRWLARRPVLLIRGALSDILEAPVAERMARVSRRLTYAEIPGVGHAPMLDEPDALRAIADWLERAP